MYIYIYDKIASKKRFNKTLINIEKKITDLGLNGKIVRLEKISNIENIIGDEIRQGASTVIAVGNDETVNRTVNAIFKNLTNGNQKPPAFGIIPLDEKRNTIAGAMGINSIKESCEILLSRRVEKINLGLIDNYYFLAQIDIHGFNSEIKIGHDYSIEIKNKKDLSILNFPIFKNLPQNTQPDPKDKNLELLLHGRGRKLLKNNGSKLDSSSFFSLQKMKILNKNNSFLIDNCITLNSEEAKIKVSDRSMNFIVGKNRNF